MIGRKQSASPLKGIGGLVVTVYPDEAMELTHNGEKILVAAERAPGSSAQCRVRILTAKHIGIRKIDSEAVIRIVKLLKGLDP